MSTAAQVAADMVKLAASTNNARRAVVVKHGARLQTQAKANASGRPGPNQVTGNFSRSINRLTTHTVASSTSEVGSSAPQAMRLEHGFQGEDSLGRSYCVDEDTEVMTQAGWQSHHDLQPGTMILTLNPDTWTAQWQPALAINRFDGPHDIVTIDSRTLSARTTPDHRWLIERYYGRKKTWLREWRTTATMPPNGRVPLAAKNDDLPYVIEVDDDIVELVGWLWTEGSFDWPKIDGQRVKGIRPISFSISQSRSANPTKCDRVEALLTRLFGPHGRLRDGHNWNIHHNATTGVNHYRIDRVGTWLVRDTMAFTTKALNPAWLLKLTQSQLELLIDVSMMADGHVDRNGVVRLGQADEDRIRSWEMACVLAGRAIRTRHDPGAQWTTTLLRTPWSHGFGSALRPDRGHASVDVSETADLVWCPTTENGTWLARRHGCVYFTGNSQPAYPTFGPAIDEIEPGFLAEIATIGIPGSARKLR